MPRATLSFPLLLLAACAGDTRHSSAVRTIHASAVHVVGGSESLVRVMDLQPAPDGMVWVLNNTEPFFVAIGPDGSVRHAAGKRGGGPHEFQSPTRLVAGTETDDIWVYELSRHALIRVAGARDWQELSLPRDSLPPGRLLSFDVAGMFGTRPWLARVGAGFLMTRTRAGVDASLRLWNADLIELDVSDLSVRTVTSIADLLGDPAARHGEAQFLLPFPLWSLCADGTFVLYDPLRNQLRRFERARTEHEPIDLPTERALEVTLERTFALAYRQALKQGQMPDSVTMRREYETQVRNIHHQMSRVFPEYADLQCADSGTLWLQRFDLDGVEYGKGAEWLRISADGSTQTYYLPERFQPFRFVGSRSWGVLFDEYDVPHVAWIELP